MKFGVDSPFVNLLGFDLQLFEGGKSVIGFVPQADHHNAFGVTQDGALMTLLDVAMASAARSVQKDVGLVTIEMTTCFMQTVRGSLTCTGRLMHRSRAMAFAEAIVFDAAGQPCAHATGTFKFTRVLATGETGVDALRNAPAERHEPACDATTC